MLLSSWLVECQRHPLKESSVESTCRSRTVRSCDLPYVVGAWKLSARCRGLVPTRSILPDFPAPIALTPVAHGNIARLWAMSGTIRFASAYCALDPAHRFSALGSLARSHLLPTVPLFFLLRSPVIYTREALSIYQSCADKTRPLFLDTIPSPYPHCLIDTPFHPS
jgi:hypothetical protein